MWAMFNDEGRIIATYLGQPGQTTEDMTEAYGNNFLWDDAVIDVDNSWVNSDSLEAKAALTATWDAVTVPADGAAEIVLSDLPIPCTVIIDYDQSVEVADGSLEFTADAPGTYSVVVDEVAYIRQEWTVDAI